MELLFVVLGGLIIGFIARYVFPLRETHGALLIPALGAVTAAIVWEALTWLGLPYDGGWIWVITFVATAIVTAVAAPAVGRQRRNRDRAELSRLLAPKARVS